STLRAGLEAADGVFSVVILARDNTVRSRTATAGCLFLTQDTSDTQQQQTALRQHQCGHPLTSSGY
ncbi:hypothetical protein D7Y23_26555, partial [Corallococcus sp. AB050B]